MDEVELVVALEAVRQRRTQAQGEEADRVWESHLREAWLLIALGRPDEAIEAARTGQREYSGFRRRNPSPYGGSLVWDACAAEAVAHLACERWQEAQASARRALLDFSEETTNYYLMELALQAQGLLSPDRVYKAIKDPSRELAHFDAREFARRRMDRPLA